VNNSYTLNSLAQYLGWGNQMSDEAIWNFAIKREHTLRMAQNALETHLSDAATAEEALLDRINLLKAERSTS
jgi:hypothetical protein